MCIDVMLQVIDVVDFRMFTISIVLIQTCIHLSHKGVPVHAVAVKDILIDFFLYVPTLGYMDFISVCLGILTALALTQNV